GSSRRTQGSPTELLRLAKCISSRTKRSPLKTCRGRRRGRFRSGPATCARRDRDRKSTRLNSSHVSISYAVFCLKKKTTNTVILGYIDLMRLLALFSP